MAEFDHGFWVMLVDGSLTYSISYGLTVLGQQILMIDYGFDEVKADFLLTLPSLIVIFLMPTVGLFSDHFGYRQSVLIGTNLLQLCMLSVPILIDTCDQCSSIQTLFVLQGWISAVFMVLQWGSMSYFVRQSGIITAYCVFTCFTNLFISVLNPFLASLIFETDGEVDHSQVKLALFIMSIASLTLKLHLWRWDKTERGGILQSSEIDADFQAYLRRRDNE